ncbi:Tropinone reductase 2 [Pseudolycoriella hygida]|uniref:Tropinone reductase 2 n=1 Tax=Pseudolycoriella hygida TaxID=35572 RepID=A0A9Q0S8W5_9DIPT|nr:Tropinone reductase 2 [Pseudolycoriella hygida]
MPDADNIETTLEEFIAVKNALDFSGKVVLISGSSSGIGLFAKIQDPNFNDVYSQVKAINEEAQLEVTRLAAPYLTKAKGSIIFIASILARNPAESTGAYSMTKNALVAFAKTLAHDLGPGVRINVISIAAVPKLWTKKYKNIYKCYWPKKHADSLRKKLILPAIKNDEENVFRCRLLSKETYNSFQEAFTAEVKLAARAPLKSCRKTTSAKSQKENKQTIAQVQMDVCLGLLRSSSILIFTRTNSMMTQILSGSTHVSVENHLKHNLGYDVLDNFEHDQDNYTHNIMGNQLTTFDESDQLNTKKIDFSLENATDKLVGPRNRGTESDSPKQSNTCIFWKKRIVDSYEMGTPKSMIINELDNPFNMVDLDFSIYDLFDTSKEGSNQENVVEELETMLLSTGDSYLPNGHASANSFGALENISEKTHKESGKKLFTLPSGEMSADNGDHLRITNLERIGLFAEIEDPNFNDVYSQVKAINEEAHLDVTRLAAPYLKDANGSIIFMASILGWNPGKSTGAYSMTKSSLLAIAKTLTHDLGPGVRVNVISPGTVDGTRLFRLFPPSIRPAGIAKAIENTALQRAGIPMDIAKAVVFLASPLSSYIDGQDFHVDGGEFITIW